MKLSKCPKCNERQKALTLLLINNMTNKKCHQCGCTLDFDQVKTKYFILVSLFPLYILLYISMQFIDELGVLLLVFVLVLLIGSMLYITLVPLVEKDKT